MWRFASGWLPRGRPVPIAGLGLLVEQADRAGNRLTITRDQNGGITQLTEPGGRVLTFTTTLLNPGDVTSARLTEVRDPLGRTVRYGYDPFTRRLTSVTDPAGGETRYAYDAAGRLLSITDPRGLTFLANGYDFEGRVVRQVQSQ